MKPEDILPDISDDSVITFEDKAILLKKLKSIIVNALGLPQTYAGIWEREGLPISAKIQSQPNEHENTYRFRQREAWFREGADCKLLQPGSPGWRKGKLKITVSVDFIEDLPETAPAEADRPDPSPLDAIRQTPDTSPNP